MKNIKSRKINRLLVAVFILLSIIGLNLSVTTANTGDFCFNCQAHCFAQTDGTTAYNACIALCNYAGCDIPYAVPIINRGISAK